MLGSRSNNCPRISVVTANYNHGDFLEETMDSVLAQNYPNLEYILIDGGSSDRSVEIIKKHAKHLAYWCSEPDQGHYDAVNKGFRHATGEVMAFLNSDDKYFPDALQTVGEIFTLFPQVRWLTSTLPSLLDYSGRCFNVIKQPGYSRDAFLDGGYGGRENFRVGFIFQDSTFWRATLWSDIGNCLRTEYTHAADFDLWCRFYLHAELYGMSVQLGGLRVRHDQRGREGNLYEDQQIKALLQMREALHWNPNKLREFCLRARLFDLPKISGFLRPRIGYVNHEIVRRSPDTAEPGWQINLQHFPTYRQTF